MPLNFNALDAARRVAGGVNRALAGSLAGALAIMGAMAATPALAGQQTGTVLYVVVRSPDGLIYFGLSGSISSPPPCATHGYWMIRDENSVAGKQQLATLLAARASGQPVTVTGQGSCLRWSDGEDVGAIRY